MKNTLIILILLLLTNCQKNQVIKTHGVAYLEKKQENLLVNQANQNEVRLSLGNPSTEGLFDETIWIYIERTITKGKVLKLGQNVLMKNNVLVLKFDKYGILSEKNFYDKNNMNELKFTKDTTEAVSKQQDFVYSFLSSIRQKMYKRK